MVKLHQDFKEFIELLNARKVEYLVVGSFAMAFHGHPRNTGDIDFWINNSRDNAKLVYEVLNEFGFPMNNISVSDFTSNDLIFQMGYPPVRIDILTSVEELSFEKSFSQKVSITVDGTKVDFINLEDLKKNKKAVGRSKDLADLERLEKNEDI